MSSPVPAVKPFKRPPAGKWSATGLDFGLAVGQAAAAAVVFTGLGTLALISHGLVRTAALVAVALLYMALGGASIAALISHLTGPTDWGAQNVIRGAGLVAGATLACLAVLTAVLVQGGTVPAHTGAHNAGLLADLDGWYAWNAINLIPLLSVPTTLGWTQPDVVGGHLAGVIMLMFKLFWVAVFLRLAVLVFRGTIAHPLWFSGDGLHSRPPYVVSEEEAARKVAEFDRARADPRPPGPIDPGQFGLGLRKALDDPRWMTAEQAQRHRRFLINEPARSAEYSRRMHERTVRLNTALEGASAVVAVVGAAVVVGTSSLAVEAGFLAACVVFSGWSFAETNSDLWPYLFGRAALEQTGQLRFYAIADRVAAFVRLTVIFVLVTALLDDLGLVSVVGLPASAKVTAGQAATFYVWHSLDAIPGLDIPTTLNWQLTHPLTDILSRVLLLTYKAFILLPLLGLLYLLMQKIWGETPWSQAQGESAPAAALSKSAEPHG